MKKRFILFVLLLLLIGCKADPPPNTPSILEDLVCEPPCWQNIIPGETTEQELLNILDQIPNLDKGSIFIRGGPWNSFSNTVRFDLIKKNFLVEVSIFLFEDIVALISIQGDIGINIGDAISALGEPTSILILFYESYYPIFFNESMGIAFMYDAYFLPRKSRGEIYPEIKIEEIDFFDPEIFPQLIELRIFTYGVVDPQKLFEKIYPWNGYGYIEEKYFP